MDFIFQESTIAEYGGKLLFKANGSISCFYFIGDIQLFADEVERCFDEYQRLSGASSVPLRSYFREQMEENFKNSVEVSFS